MNKLEDHAQDHVEDHAEDHVSIGKRLDLLVQEPTIGKGLPLLTPRGATIRRVLQRFVEDEEIRRGYEHTWTPSMGRTEIYRVSGHWDYYREHMFEISDESEDGLALRPMTCPYQFYLYKRKLHSYHDLPVRYAETSTLFRNEDSGAIHGLIRIRQFTLSDGHIICSGEQLEEEFLAAFELVQYMFEVLGLEGYWFRFSQRDDSGKYIDNEEMWESSEKLMKSILDKLGIDYIEGPGEAVFYGPKLDVQMKNVHGKEDTIFTLQIDFALAERFDMTYTDRDGSEKRPFIVHRSSVGCYERTMAFLLEQYQGDLPFWLAPEQVRIVTISDALVPYASEIQKELSTSAIRCDVDGRSETLGRKIMDARTLRVPLTVVVGKKEQAANTVSVRDIKGNTMNNVDRDVFAQWCKCLDAGRVTRFTLQDLGLAV